ncbi:hypothetical protein [Oceanobacillus halotolerans]|uniref:hypothetical protein n=1 Tax=Oceanobacillus halotolerans TaxID=2663380 RepID=UPI0013DAF4CC|nr:hypothetical protein [Oceanobacillus halotolerans]
MLQSILLIGAIIASILFMVYDHNIKKEMKARKNTIESQHALIEVLGERLKVKESLNEK